MALLEEFDLNEQFYRLSEKNIIINVMPSYSHNNKSNQNDFVWNYQIEIQNNNIFPIKLLSRNWIIYDAHGVEKQISGPGVVGKQPIIEPGKSFNYSSFVNLAVSSGMMAGSFNFLNIITGEVFKSAVPSFSLDLPYLKPNFN